MQRFSLRFFLLNLRLVQNFNMTVQFIIRIIMIYSYLHLEAVREIGVVDVWQTVLQFTDVMND